MRSASDTHAMLVDHEIRVVRLELQLERVVTQKQALIALNIALPIVPLALFIGLFLR